MLIHCSEGQWGIDNVFQAEAINVCITRCGLR